MKKRNRDSRKLFVDKASDKSSAKQNDDAEVRSIEQIISAGLDGPGVSGDYASEIEDFIARVEDTEPSERAKLASDDIPEVLGKGNASDANGVDSIAASEASVKPVDAGFMAPEESPYKAYGEPLPEEKPAPEKSAELEAMEALLSSDSEFGTLPHPDIFNAYPPEVQRKIMEWTDRDVKARRDDESRRKDELVRATIDRDRRRQSVPAIITVIALICGAVVGLATGNPWFAVAFLLVPLFMIIGIFVSDNMKHNARGDRYRKPPK